MSPEWFVFIIWRWFKGPITEGVEDVVEGRRRAFKGKVSWNEVMCVSYIRIFRKEGRGVVQK